MSEPEEILSRVELQKGAIELSGVEEMKAQTSALKWSKKEGEKFPQEIGQEEVPTTTKDGIGRQWSADDGKLTDTVVFQVETTTEPSYSTETTSIPSVDLDVQSPPLLSSKQPVTKGQTLLKEQELIIEQMMAKASDNQRLPEVAKAAEQLREENRIKRAAEIEADNGKLKNAMENIHHELAKYKAMVDELKQSVEMKEAKIKQLVSEVQRLETKLAATGKAWEEKAKSTESLALIEENHKLKSRVRSLETETEQQKEETEAMRAVIAELQRTAATANVSQRMDNKQGTSIDESKEREMTPEEKKTKRQSENVDISNENSSPSTQGTVSTSGNRQKQQGNGQLKNRWKEPKSTSYILSGKKKLIVHSEHRDGANVFAEKGFPSTRQLTRTDNFPGTISGYFELKITETVGKCFHLYIGMYPGGNLNSKLGQKKHSYALHYPILKTKKNVFTGTTTAKQLTTGSADLPKWNRGPGDVVGCGIFPISRHIFFTGNGVILGVYSMGNSLDDLFPAMKVEGVKVETNFGDDPFIMNINELNSLCAEYQHDDDEQ